MANHDTPTPEQKREVDNKCADAALDASLTSFLTNRFEVIPHPDGPGAGAILVLGSALAGAYGQTRDTAKPFVKVKMYGAYAVNRTFAADVAAKLQLVLGLTEDEIKDAKVRNSATGETNA